MIPCVNAIGNSISPMLMFGPWKIYYVSVMNGLIVSSLGRPTQMYEAAELVGNAYKKAFMKENIEKGFQVTIIHPVERNVFTEDEFLSTYITDCKLVQKNTNTTDNYQAQQSTNEVTSISSTPTTYQ